MEQPASSLQLYRFVQEIDQLIANAALYQPVQAKGAQLTDIPQLSPERVERRFLFQYSKNAREEPVIFSKYHDKQSLAKYLRKSYFSKSCGLRILLHQVVFLCAKKWETFSLFLSWFLQTFFHCSFGV